MNSCCTSSADSSVGLAEARSEEESLDGAKSAAFGASPSMLPMVEGSCGEDGSQTVSPAGDTPSRPSIVAATSEIR